MDYGPALHPCLVLDQHDTSDQYVAASELPPKKVSDQPKKHSHSRSRLDIESRSASDQSNVESDESLSPPVGGRLHSFRRDWQTNKCSPNVLNIITNGYVLPFLSKPNLVRFPLILSEYKAHQKDQTLASCIQSLLSKNAIERVKNVKSLGFYSCLFLVPKPHQRWRPVIDLSRLNTFLHIEKFKMETPESIRTSHSRGVGIVDRSVGCFPTHPYPSKLKEIPKVLLHVTGVPVHLPPIRTSHSPPGLYNDRKGSETNGPLQRTQSSPIPG